MKGIKCRVFPCLTLFGAFQPFQSAQTVAGQGMGRGAAVLGEMDPTQVIHPDCRGSLPVHKVTGTHLTIQQLREAVRGSPHTRWTMPILPGLIKSFGDGDTGWRGKKRGRLHLLKFLFTK